AVAIIQALHTAVGVLVANRGITFTSVVAWVRLAAYACSAGLHSTDGRRAATASTCGPVTNAAEAAKPGATSACSGARKSAPASSTDAFARGAADFRRRAILDVFTGHSHPKEVASNEQCQGPS